MPPRMGPTKSNRREIPPRLSQSYFRRTRIGGLTQFVTVHVLKVGKLARLTAFRTTSRFHTACSAALFVVHTTQMLRYAATANSHEAAIVLFWRTVTE